jgi:serine/threonine-protein kinase HipA
VDQDGRLAIGKFPSVNDTRSEVLALKLAQLAGIDAAPARIVSLAEVPVAVIRRFDRDGDHGRIPYLDILDFWQSSGMALTR